MIQLETLTDREVIELERQHGGAVNAARAIGCGKTAFYSRRRTAVDNIKNASASAANSAGQTAAANADLLPAGVSPFGLPIIANEIPEKIPHFEPRSFYSQLSVYHSLRKTLMLIGPAGAGKTAAFRQYAAENMLPLLSIPCDFGLELREWLGCKDITISGGISFKLGRAIPFLTAPSIILLDEINLIEPEFQAPLFKLLNDRKIDSGAGEIEVTVHPDCWIVATGNQLNGRYNGVNPLTAAVGNRIGGVFNVKAFDISELRKILNRQFNLESEELSQILSFYAEANRAGDENNFSTVLSLRNLTSYCELRQAGADKAAAVESCLINPALIASDAIEEFDTLKRLAVAAISGLDM